MQAAPAASLARGAARGTVASAAGLVLALAAAFGWLAITKTAGQESLATTAAARQEQASELAAALTRTGTAGASEEVQVTLATPDFFRLTGRGAEGQQLGADGGLLFVVTENVHFGDLPHHLGVLLRADGRIYAPTSTTTLTDAIHHRTSAVLFADVPPSYLAGDHALELLLPPADSGERSTLPWRTPIPYPGALQGTSVPGPGLLLALAAGLLAAISPCLVQLTAFYLPTLAGVSVDPANREGPGVDRRRVVPVAFVFILGFTIPYTAGGALMGAIGGTLAASGLLSPTGPIAAGAGAVMIVMALLVARRARAPLVCAVPLPAAVERSRRLPFVEAFVSGFAIATGCLACFGGAILGVLVVYAGLMGSPLLGGLAMLVFSLGLAVPFLLAAVGLSRVRPLLDLAARATPAVGLLTAGAMLFFGVSMATGNYHVVSGWLFQHLPLR